MRSSKIGRLNTYACSTKYLKCIVSKFRFWNLTGYLAGRVLIEWIALEAIMENAWRAELNLQEQSWEPNFCYENSTKMILISMGKTMIERWEKINKKLEAQYFPQ